MWFSHIKSDFSKICSFIIYLLPLALISGPLFSDLFVSILGIFAIYIILRFKEFHYLKNKFIIIIFFWWLYLIFLSLSSENIYLSLESSLFYFRFIFFVIAIWFVLENKKNFLKYFYYSLFFIDCDINIVCIFVLNCGYSFCHQIIEIRSPFFPIFQEVLSQNSHLNRNIFYISN